MSNIVMYLLMRNDMPSMNPGKLAAQASHVANACVYSIRNSQNSHLKKMLKMWEKETNFGFGTAICLAANEQKLWEIKHRNPTFHYDIIEDPSYPSYIPTEEAKFLISDKVDKGNSYDIIVREDKPMSILLRPEYVGAYLFGDRTNPEIQKAVKGLELYP